LERLGTGAAAQFSDEQVLVLGHRGRHLDWRRGAVTVRSKRDGVSPHSPMTLFAADPVGRGGIGTAPWLEYEHVPTTQIYFHGDLTMK
jgi:hypothetical protein